MLGSTCLRMGSTLLVLWLALPQVLSLTTRFPPRLLIAAALGVLIVVVRPRAFPFVALVVLAVCVVEAVGWLMRPQTKSRK
jgi:hypothetical protein